MQAGAGAFMRGGCSRERWPTSLVPDRPTGDVRCTSRQRLRWVRAPALDVMRYKIIMIKIIGVALHNPPFMALENEIGMFQSEIVVGIFTLHGGDIYTA